MSKFVRVAAIQSGPLGEDQQRNIEYCSDLLEKAAQEKPDFVVFPELGTVPFFCLGLRDKSFFSLAERISGPTVQLFARKAKEFGTNVILPLFEKGEVEGEYYDSVVVIGQDGEILAGSLPDASKVRSVRKNYISDFKWEPHQVNDEKYYFRPGNGHPVFQTQKCRIGVLICYERWYPEAWRVLSLQGADVIFVTNASAGYVSETALCLLRANAAMNAVFCVCVNKAGVEHVKSAEANYYGLSAIIDPKGNIIEQIKDDRQSVILTADLDLDKVRDARTDLFVYRDRIPEFYTLISSRP